MKRRAMKAGKPRRSWPDLAAFPELAPFERHVAMLLIDDVSRPSIVELLDVSHQTVSTSRYRLLAKLGVKGHAGLARLAIRRGYVQP